jgi:hypothetical protein
MHKIQNLNKLQKYLLNHCILNRTLSPENGKNTCLSVFCFFQNFEHIIHYFSYSQIASL